MRFLLRPGWLALVASVLAFVVACYALLAPWQFGREQQRDARDVAIEAADAVAPVPLAELVPAGGAVTPDTEWRHVRVTGTYLPEAEALVRLRVIDGKPAFEVLTPLRTIDGWLVTVNRGYVAAAAGADAVPAVEPAPSGQVEVTGRLRVNESDPQRRAPLRTEGHLQVYAIDAEALSAATGLQLPAGHLQLAGAQPGALTPVPVTGHGSAAPFTNLSYALQWLTFGAIALVALGYFIRLEVLQRRGAGAARPAGRDPIRDAGLPDPGGDAGLPDPGGAAGPAGRGPGGPSAADVAPTGPRSPLADRYGRR